MPFYLGGLPWSWSMNSRTPTLLGAGTLLASGRQAARPWLTACGLADAFDAATTAAGYRRLPPGRRALTFVVSAIPALLNLGTAQRIEPTGTRI